MDSEELTTSDKYQIIDTRQIEYCRIWGDRYGHGFLDVTDEKDNSYRIKEEALLHILRGDIYKLYVNEKYGRRYLEIDPPNRKRRR